jgi:hypothetical protein
VDLVMTRARGIARVAAFIIIAAHPVAARAQFFSPGPLARPHASLEGLEKCKQCHQEQKGLSAKLCLDCHGEINARVAKGAGFHGHMQPAKREACQSCHPDHRGVDFSMVEWEGGKNKFQHQQTGWPLKGQHAKTKCDDCHQRRLIIEASIRRLLDNQPKRTTMLGLGQRCDSCHFDEHRGQLGRECQTCHDEAAWKPPAKFNHNASAFPLKGKHKEVACAKCHPSETDTHIVANAFPAPRATTFMEMKPIEHKTCESCHDDPHKGSLGPACASCHAETGWKVIHTSSGKDTSFHDKTQFPLRGGHVGVECRACHGPFPGSPAKFKGLPFAACSDCHQDAHLGQLRAKPPAKVAACDQCHTVNAFVPVRYEVEQHRETKFPLEGGHGATACRGCHPIDDKLSAKIPAAVHRLLRERKRPERFSLAVLHPKKALQSCLGCHEDVHRGQLAEDGNKDNCASCHETTSFADLTFDHDKDSRFPLTGKHAKTACAACHPSERVGPGQTMVRYKPLDTACKSCHADQHQGQFLARNKPPDCDFCHETATFKKTLFNHADTRFTSFALDGKHSKLPCASCHPTVTVAESVKTVRYRPVPRTCEACHVDFHHGQFKGFEP